MRRGLRGGDEGRIEGRNDKRGWVEGRIEGRG